MRCRTLGKECYLTPQSANLALDSIRGRKAKKAAWHSGKAIAYQCAHCHMWHIGHAAPKDRLKKP